MSADSYAQSGRRRKQKVLARNSETPKHRSSKDTKRWCKGIVGREHVWTYRGWKNLDFNPPITAKVCANCRRLQELVGGSFGGRWGKQGPAY